MTKSKEAKDNQRFINNYEIIMRIMGRDTKDTKTNSTNLFDDLDTKAKSAYPMLNHIDTYGGSSTKVENILAYIKLIDSQ